MTSWQSGRASALLEKCKPSSISRVRMALSGLVLLAAIALAPAATALMQVPDDPSPESGTAQVVAQGVVDIAGGDLRWQVTERIAQPPANAAEVVSDLGFVTVGSGVMLVEDLVTGEQYRLPAGEAALFHGGAEQSRVALGSDVATYRDLSLVEVTAEVPADGTTVFQSDPFAGTGARNDLDLLHDALAPATATTIPAGSLPTLIVVLDGSADVATESGDIISLGPGEAASLPGALTITAGENGAAIAAAYTSPAVPSLTQAIGTPGAGREVEAAGEEPVAVVVASPVATQPAEDATDEDGDGLASTQEAEAGTDPALADTDEDGLTDGQEVSEFGTNPLAPDTDGDGVLDGDEVVQGTDPSDAAAGAVLVADEPVVEEPAAEVEQPEAVVEEPAVAEEVAPAAASAPGDSDGDGLEDAIEFELGTDPFDTDTDDDGLTDGDEYYVFATGTRNPDSDGDGVLDGDEAAVGTDPNNPSS